MSITNLLEGFLSIVGNITTTLMSLFTYTLDLSSIGLGEINLLLLFSGTALLGYLIYKIVRLLI